MAVATISEATNTKLGPLIHAWAIPAGTTCPGETALCSTACYAKAGHFRYGTTQACHLRNLAFSRTPEFVDWMRSSLSANFVRVMRVHTAGDFYDLDYVRKWQQIITSCRQTQFFGYTRSWRIPELLPALIQLSQAPNMSLWWSLDRETGPAPIVRGIRRAYMAIDDVDAQTAPNDCDLVFRVRTSQPMKKANGIQVCPPENGVTTQSKITCSRCGICWRSQTAPRWEGLLTTAPARELLAPTNQGRSNALSHSQT